ncbi:MAG: helix-turn-helix domain-containing protein [Oscillospiraceae bacterium]
MGIQQNMADTIRMIMSINGKTLEEFAEDLQIARSTLQDYLKAEGNPTAVMIEHVAERLSIDPAVLLTGLLDMDRRDIILLLFNNIQEIVVLPREKQLRFAELFLEIVLLWNQNPG